MAARQNNIEGFLGVVNALDVGLRGDAVKDDAATLTAILTNAKGALVIIPPSPGASYLLGSGVSVPVNGACWVLPGVVFSGAGSLTATAGGLLIDQRAGTFVVSGVALKSQAVSALRSVTTTATAAATDGLIQADATAGAFAVTLPAASGTGAVLTIKKIDSSANAVTITAAGSDKIDGAATAALSTQYKSFTIVDAAAAVWLKVASI